PEETAVLVRAYDPADPNGISRCALIATNDDPDTPRVLDLIEKPSADRARELEDRHGREHLWLLEGRSRPSAHFLNWLRAAPTPSGREPKLSLAYGDYALAGNPIRLVPTTSPITDLGT